MKDIIVRKMMANKLGMSLEDVTTSLELLKTSTESKHPKCSGYYDEWNGDYGCHYNSVLSCEECKYGLGRKDPEAKCNQN